MWRTPVLSTEVMILDVLQSMRLKTNIFRLLLIRGLQDILLIAKVRGDLSFL